MHSSILNLTSELKLPQVFDLCILQPTSPLRTADDINNAFSIYYKNSSKSLVSASLVSHTSSPEKVMTCNSRGKLLFSQQYSGANRDKILDKYYAQVMLYNTFFYA